ncbi:NAD(P)-dependent oxidoreductase [Pendulispora albinea]|uniref:NAD(P)H-binding protein n=1 Tax=Pendulispora albinea TaxID=2741071 RepID=A0ABZ2M4X1_9BACT
MNIGIIGATGNIGRRIADEALRRGHRVTAIARDASRVPPEKSGKVAWKVADVFDPEGLARALDDVDVLVSTYQPGNASIDIADTIQRSIADPSVYAAAARSMLRAIERTRPSMRLIVVGGAGSLEIRPGLALVDSPDAEARLEKLGIPKEYKVAVEGHRDALNVLRLSNRNWTYVSPAEQIRAGERTGRFRLGDNQPVLDRDGESRISYEDLAVALIDEVEIPKYVQRRFTLGY